MAEGRIKLGVVGSDGTMGGPGGTPLNQAVLAQAVNVVATANLELSGLQTIDGVVLAAKNVVLATGQTAASKSGPWVVAAGAWTRPVWFASGENIEAARLVVVQEGTVHGGEDWLLANSGVVIKVDTNVQTWSMHLPSSVVRSSATTVGDGVAKAFTVNHNLESTDVMTTVIDLTLKEVVYPTVDVTGVNTVEVKFAAVPTVNQYRVLVGRF